MHHDSDNYNRTSDFLVLRFLPTKLSRSIPLPGLLWLPGLRLGRRRDLCADRSGRRRVADPVRCWVTQHENLGFNRSDYSSQPL